MARHILIIDRLISANHRMLARRAKMSMRDRIASGYRSAVGRRASLVWGRAWDACPDLKAIDTKLFAERMQVTDARDRAEQRVADKAERAQRARYRAAGKAERLSAGCA